MIQTELLKIDPNMSKDMNGYIGDGSAAAQLTDGLFHQAFLRVNSQHDGMFYDEAARRVSLLKKEDIQKENA